MKFREIYIFKIYLSKFKKKIAKLEFWESLQLFLRQVHRVHAKMHVLRVPKKTNRITLKVNEFRRYLSKVWVRFSPGDRPCRFDNVDTIRSVGLTKRGHIKKLAPGYLASPPW